VAAQGSHFFHSVRIRTQQPARRHRAFLLWHGLDGTSGAGGSGGFCAGPFCRVLGMVPRWLKHRSAAREAQATQQAPNAAANATSAAPAVKEQNSSSIIAPGDVHGI
jgi:hypothetical protein